MIQRGNNRNACFAGDRDRLLFLGLLEELAKEEACAIHAYVLMTNHVHMLITPHREGALSRLMQHVGRRYVLHFNKVHGRTGTLWEGRFKSCAVDSGSYLLRCHRYIELNPVRAGMVRGPGDYAWSSYNTNARGFPSTLLTPHPRIRALGIDVEVGREIYRRLFDAGLTETELIKIRAACNTGVPLGSPEFVAAIVGKRKRRKT